MPRPRYRRTPRNVDDREVASARLRMVAVPPIERVADITDPVGDDGCRAVRARRERDGGGASHLVVGRAAEGREVGVHDRAVLLPGRHALHPVLIPAVAGLDKPRGQNADRGIRRRTTGPGRWDGVIPAHARVAVHRDPGNADRDRRSSGRHGKGDGANPHQQPLASPRRHVAADRRAEPHRILARHIDQVQVIAQLVDRSAVPSRFPRGERVRDENGVCPHQSVKAHSGGGPHPHDLLDPALRRAKRLFGVARIVGHALLLGPPEQDARDQCTADDQGHQHQRERDAAFPPYHLGLFRKVMATDRLSTTYAGVALACRTRVAVWPRSAMPIRATLDESVVTTPFPS